MFYVWSFLQNKRKLSTVARLMEQNKLIKPVKIPFRNFFHGSKYFLTFKAKQIFSIHKNLFLLRLRYFAWLLRFIFLSQMNHIIVRAATTHVISTVWVNSKIKIITMDLRKKKRNRNLYFCFHAYNIISYYINHTILYLALIISRKKTHAKPNKFALNFLFCQSKHKQSWKITKQTIFSHSTWIWISFLFSKICLNVTRWNLKHKCKYFT